MSTNKTSRLYQIVTFIFLMLVSFLAAFDNVAPHIHRPDGCDNGADGVIHAVNLVIPDAHIFIRAFRFNGVVPAAFKIIAVNIRIFVWETMIADIAAGAENVAKIVVVIRVKLIVANNVIAFCIIKHHAIGALRMIGVAVRIGPRLAPTVGVRARVMDFVVLDDQPFDVIRAVRRTDRGLQIDAVAC